MTHGNWPLRRDLETARLVCRAKRTFGVGTVREWRHGYYFLPDEGEPILRLGGAFPYSDAMPKAENDVAQLRLEVA